MPLPSLLQWVSIRTAACDSTARQRDKKSILFRPTYAAPRRKTRETLCTTALHTRSASSTWCTQHSMQSFSLSVQSYCSSTHTTAPQRTAACTTPVGTSSFFPPHIDQKPPNLNKRCCSTLCMFYAAQSFGRRPVLAKHFLESPVGNSARCFEKITSAKIFWDSDKFTTYGFWNLNFLLHTASGTCNFFVAVCRNLCTVTRM